MRKATSVGQETELNESRRTTVESSAFVHLWPLCRPLARSLTNFDFGQQVAQAKYGRESSACLMLLPSRECSEAFEWPGVVRLMAGWKVEEQVMESQQRSSTRRLAENLSSTMWQDCEFRRPSPYRITIRRLCSSGMIGVRLGT